LRLGAPPKRCASAAVPERPPELPALAALGQERQLASHVRGTLRCGGTRAELDEALGALDGLADPERIEHAQRGLERFGAG
jgi:alkylhydroperoxidase/carboxymuconolactone decarboxylase family protein YurZ